MRLPLRLGRLPGPLRRRWARPVVRPVSRRLAAWDVRRVRAGRAPIGGVVAGGAPVLLLTTTGRRSRQPRTVPLLYHREPDDGLLLVAVNGTADWDPDWLRNLAAAPDAAVRLDGVDHRVTAEVLDGAERTAAFAAAAASLPGLIPAQETSRRAIPVVRLRLRGSPLPRA
jgi:deazaflavin-dependent oxidoreductase (nitroreductase family)